jgi:thiamine biosynthesis protein ThiS
MEILVNGQAQSVQDGTTAAHLLDLLYAESPPVALAINDRVVIRSQHASTQLHPGDRIEIVEAVGGG